MKLITASFALLLLLPSFSTFSSDWSMTQLHINQGNFTNPFSKDKASTQIYSIQHTSSYAYGDNFFFIDYSVDDNNDGFQDRDFYAEWYSSLSASKTFNWQSTYSIISDMSFTFGFNAASDAKVLKYLPGIKINWALKDFNFFSTLLTAYIDDSEGISNSGAPSESNGWMLDVAWGRPFYVGSQKFNFTGHIEYIDARTNELGNKVNSWVLAQPIIQWDLGHALSLSSEQLWLGIELQYWHNKLGTNESETVPQLHLAWTF